MHFDEVFIVLDIYTQCLRLFGSCQVFVEAHFVSGLPFTEVNLLSLSQGWEGLRVGGVMVRCCNHSHVASIRCWFSGGQELVNAFQFGFGLLLFILLGSLPFLVKFVLVYSHWWHRLPTVHSVMVFKPLQVNNGPSSLALENREPSPMLKVSLYELRKNVLLLLGCESDCWVGLTCSTQHVLGLCSDTIFDGLLTAASHTQLFHGLESNVFWAKVVVAKV